MSVSTMPAAAKTDAARRRRKMMRNFNERWPAFVAAFGMIALWWAIIVIGKVPEYIAPSPLVVAETFREKWPTLLNNFLPTMLEALAGFVLGNGIAVILAIWFVHSRFAERAFFPIAVFVQTIPVLALAPILVLIWGNSPTAKVVIAALVCFFPTLVNMVRGLKSMSSQMEELMRVLSANRREVLFKVRLQASLPYLFAALKIASTTCVVGAIVGEWIGSNYGLGWLIIDSMYNFRSPTLYATIIMGSMLAVLLFSITTLAERLLLTWKPANAH